MISVRKSLACWLIFGMLVTTALAGTGLYAYLHHVICRDFDRSLMLRAHAIESLVAIKPGGKWDIDIHTNALREYATLRSGDFYRVFDDAGKLITSSANDPLKDLSTLRLSAISDKKLGFGVSVRAATLRFRPPIEDDSNPGNPRMLPGVEQPFANIIVGRDRHPLDDQLWRVAIGILTAFSALILTAVGVTIFSIRQSLKPLETIAEKIGNFDLAAHDARLSSSAVPVEMIPIVRRFNDLLNRVSEMLSRERRFSADIAHELRTPIAELRTTTEVAMRFDDRPGSADRGLQRANEIAIRMQTIVSALLAFVRGDDYGVMLNPIAINLRELLDEVAKRRATECVHYTCDCTEVQVIADPALLESVLENLLGNAFQYVAAGGKVSVHDEILGDRVRLTIANSQDSLDAGELSALFNPFWRKDPARLPGPNLGLGLSLTQSYCRAMGIELTASLPEPSVFSMTLELTRVVADLPASLSYHRANESGISTSVSRSVRDRV